MSPAFWDTSALVPLCVQQQPSPAVRQLLEQHEIAVWWATPVEMRSAFERLLRMSQLSGPGTRRSRCAARETATRMAGAATQRSTPVSGRDFPDQLSPQSCRRASTRRRMDLVFRECPDLRFHLGGRSAFGGSTAGRISDRGCPDLPALPLCRYMGVSGCAYGESEKQGSDDPRALDQSRSRQTMSRASVPTGRWPGPSSRRNARARGRANSSSRTPALTVGGIHIGHADLRAAARPRSHTSTDPVKHCERRDPGEQKAEGKANAFRCSLLLR